MVIRARLKNGRIIRGHGQPINRLNRRVSHITMRRIQVRRNTLHLPIRPRARRQVVRPITTRRHISNYIRFGNNRFPTRRLTLKTSTMCIITFGRQRNTTRVAGRAVLTTIMSCITTRRIPTSCTFLPTNVRHLMSNLFLMLMPKLAVNTHQFIITNKGLLTRQSHQAFHIVGTVIFSGPPTKPVQTRRPSLVNDQQHMETNHLHRFGTKSHGMVSRQTTQMRANLTRISFNGFHVQINFVRVNPGNYNLVVSHATPRIRNNVQVGRQRSKVNNNIATNVPAL